MRILVVEDDEIIAEQVQRGLVRGGYQVDLAPDGPTGLAAAQATDYDLVVLDLLLPGCDGWVVCERLRAQRRTVPILMLTALDAVDDRVRGLDAGADDYLPKPFDFRELLARVRALVRRDRVHKTPLIRVADLEIDTVARQVTRGGREIHLTQREYSLLEALAAQEGRTVSREMILERVWREEDSLSDIVSFHVTSLRKKVDTEPDAKLIHTVHGVGYVLRRPAEVRR
ncbi:MAG: response regulator transcription factor [Fimbriimonadaceae bacterium]|nr:response regulator transcription factor [Fimbriimonadaceae bacterium]